MKKQSTKWEKICANYISAAGFISKIYKKCIQLKRKKIERNLILKWAKGQNTCMLLSCFTVLCFLFFRLSVCSKPASSRSIGTIFPTALHLFHLAALGLAVAHGVFSCSVWDLVPQPGLKPKPPVLGAQSLSHWTTREVLAFLFN